MGTELVDLTDAQLKSIPLDDELRNAVLLARKIKNKHAAIAANSSYWQVNAPDVAPIEQAMSASTPFINKL